MRIYEAIAITGRLSRPSKMPGRAYSLPARRCITGSRLRAAGVGACGVCYAFRGRNAWRPTIQAQERRYQSLTHPDWVAAMATLITKQSPAYFRWHDVGDIQSPTHLARIAAVARATPTTRHWLPTREYRMVASYIKAGCDLPPNLTIRVSAPAINKLAPIIAGLPTSTVHIDIAPEGSHVCPAAKQGGVCGSCRACWNPNVRNVSYHKH